MFSWIPYEQAAGEWEQKANQTKPNQTKQRQAD
jgi:hypothetical protein